MSRGRRRPQAPASGDDRSQGQYEKDPWRADRRPSAPRRRQPLRGGTTGIEGHERRSESEEPYEPAEGYAPFEPGHPREEGTPFGAAPPPRYLGTGFPGRGGPGFTGGYYGFGSGTLEPDWRSGRRDPVGEASPGPDRRAPRRYPPGPKGYQRSDERLREDISERLMEARYIDSSDVTVEVSAAKVVLEGTVPERRMKHAIEDLVDACPGVQDIDNRIRVRR
jgi:hypothetical protein